MSNLKYVDYRSIHLDFKNPRISEFGVNNLTPEEKILSILWTEMSVNELVYSIVSNGFWDYEPLIIIPDEEKGYLVVEGNRRLAAIKIIHEHSQYDEISLPNHIISKINQKLLDQTQKLPCIIIEDRKDAWKYIGFKHVNGPSKWGSYAKAKYIAEIHNLYSVPLETIAYQIGDTNNTAQKLYQGLMVIEQAQKEKVFDIDDIQSNRIYFSHLYTGLQREGIKTYLELKDASEEAEDPVPKNRIENLGRLLEWLYGSKKNNTQPVIKSQNPDLKNLDEVLQNREATVALIDGVELDYAHELSRSSEALFEENLLAAKRGLQKARAYLTTGYKGEDSLLKSAGTVANIADDLYSEMERIYKDLSTKKRKDRITD